MDDVTWCSATGLIDGLPATLRLTDDGLTLRYEHEPATSARELEIGRVSAVHDQVGLANGTLTVSIGKQDIVLAKAPKAEVRRLAAALRARMPEHPAPAPAPAPGEPDVPSGASPLEDLERLGRLRESGVLTEAEFEAAKATLLRRL